MKKICALLISAMLIFTSTLTYAYQDTLINFLVNGKAISMSSSAFVRDGVTYVDAKAISGALGLNCTIYADHHSVTVSNYRTSICFVPGEQFATVSDLSGQSDEEFNYRTLAGPCLYANDSYIVAARDIADVFGYTLSFNQETLTVYFGYAPAMLSQATLDSIAGKSYYFQNQAEFNLPSNGSGYCWVCSYAMVLTNLTGLRITPNDVAAVNIAQGSGGAYCHHSKIVSTFGVRFVSALSTSSPYYGGRDSLSGGTYINNPDKSDAVVRAAIKEALALHPEGVMVRYEAFPHTMVAVAAEGDIILFNDPAPAGSTYTDTGIYHAVPFAQTCIPSRGLALSDITFIQAID